MSEAHKDAEREAFERHWYDFYHSGSIKARSNGRYMQPVVQSAWEAWQARAASPQAPAVDGAEAVGEIVADDPVLGWHFKPYIGWEQLGAGAKLYAAPRREGESK